MTSRRRRPLLRKRPPYFWWILGHALALCACAISWIVTNYVFNNPELPRNYAMLKKIGQAPVPELLPVLKAPAGDALKPEQIYARYTALSEPSQAAKLTKMNSRAMRSYLKGYAAGTKVPYIEGTYRVLSVRPLTRSDLFSPGFVVRAQAWVQPSLQHPAGPYPVLIEYMFPCENRAAFTWFKPGDIMRIQKIPNCTAILHISHLGPADEPIINLTVVPLSDQEYAIGESRVVTVSPPANLNLQAKMPLFDAPPPKTP
jgi:hypothetical protein